MTRTELGSNDVDETVINLVIVKVRKVYSFARITSLL
jgi:hypothetical protein